MENMNEFYVTWRSDANPEEFPDNTSTAFKARLPQALNFKDDAWEVVLSNLCLPDDGFTTNWLLDSQDFGSDFPIRQSLATIFHQMFWKEVVVPNGMQWRLDEAIAWLDNPGDHVIRTQGRGSWHFS